MCRKNAAAKRMTHSCSRPVRSPRSPVQTASLTLFYGRRRNVFAHVSKPKHIVACRQVCRDVQDVADGVLVVAAHSVRHMRRERWLPGVLRGRIVAPRAVAPKRLRARFAWRAGLAVRPLIRQAAVRRGCCVIRTPDAARTESDARDWDARPLAPVRVGALRDECAVNRVDFPVAVDERVLVTHEGELVRLEAFLRQLLGRWTEPIRVASPMLQATSC